MIRTDRPGRHRTCTAGNLSITVQIFVALKDDLGCDRSELHAHPIGGTERSCRGASLVLPERPIAELAVLGVALTLLGLGLWLIPTRVPLFCITGELPAYSLRPPFAFGRWRMGSG